MYYPKESQFTSHASKRVFEEVYTNEDITHDNYYDGVYRLNVPHMFSTNLSQEKAISPRRVMCEPKSHVFNLKVKYFNETNTQVLGESFDQLYDFTSQNTIEEILSKITSDAATGIYKLQYEYEKEKGSLFITPICDDRQTKIHFSFSCPTFDDYASFWQILNQIGMPFDMPGDNYEDFDDYSMEPIEELYLNNVWSREPLYVHASFSSSKKHYLCRTGDFWFKPSKYYYDNTDQNYFEIFFTTDGTHRIIPFDAIKVIELCFILKQFARL